MIRFHCSIIMVCLLVAALMGAGVVGATTTASPHTIDLAKAVYFPTPSGEDVMVGQGTYEVEATEQGLRMKPVGGRSEDAKVIQANPLPHQETLDVPTVVSESVAEDSHRVALLQVDGTGLEAVGSYSGVHSRAVPRRGQPGLSGYIQLPVADRTVSGSVYIRASATDVVPDGVKHVLILIDGQPNFCSLDYGAPFECRWDSTRVTDGFHQITAFISSYNWPPLTTPAVRVFVRNNPSTRKTNGDLCSADQECIFNRCGSYPLGGKFCVGKYDGVNYYECAMRSKDGVRPGSTATDHRSGREATYVCTGQGWVKR